MTVGAIRMGQFLDLQPFLTLPDLFFFYLRLREKYCVLATSCSLEHLKLKIARAFEVGLSFEYVYRIHG